MAEMIKVFIIHFVPISRALQILLVTENKQLFLLLLLLAKSCLRQLFSRPSGVGGMKSFGQTDRHLVRLFGQTDRHSYGYIAKST